ncbi:MMPL family transporter [Mycolicibacter sp. MYC123]|uniref:MMPL family transporter n=1 Tax=[Mycobacterium] zoologicum TaxID=2872311 RepID=A0ABU5YGC1_9MYCO|nr:MULTISPECIES: MMPL family transporter [unclassified Mycolicibacter]MEB3049111.1 MMPL family transporter [Mycolicibacter sp. MYC123]MEB3061655.1 MMPL family transporter [Mycolicibacter sp. MYC101]
MIKRPFFAHMLRIFAVPIIIAWIVLTVLVNVLVPQLEVISEEHSAPLAPMDAPSMVASQLVGENFQEYKSNSTVMVVVVGQEELGEPAHHYYDEIVAKLVADKDHVEHAQDFWHDRLTAAGVQSPDAKAAYIMLNLVGNQGMTEANDSVVAVRKAIDDTAAPPGVQAYVAGPAALTADLREIGDASLVKITLFTIGAIAIMLLIVFRSIAAMLTQLFLTLLELMCARGVVAFLGFHDFMGLTTFAVNIMVMLAIAAGTDYGIFLIGRYREARLAGAERVDAYYITVRSVTPVVLGSGLTIAGASAMLYFTRLPYFHTMGIPVSVGMLVVVAAALTLGPAMLVVVTSFGLLDAKETGPGGFWRRAGIAVVRWPAPIMVASLAVIMVGLVALPGFKPGYDDRKYLPKDTPVNVSYAAAEQHFPSARMAPDITMVTSDHDMRNPADMLVLDRVAKNIMRVVGIGMIQDITRPLGIPLQHSSIPFQLSASNQLMIQNMKSLKDRIKDIDTISEQLDKDISLLIQMYGYLQEVDRTFDDTAEVTQRTVEISDQIRDHIADFDDQFRPLRSYFYWEPHCFDIPMCAAMRATFDTTDGMDQMTEQLHHLSDDITKTAHLLPQAVELLPAVVDTMKIMRGLVLTVHSTFDAFVNQMESLSNTQIMMGQSFDDSKNDDFFYLPAEAFDNKDFQIGLRQFMSPDGKSARFFVTHQTYPATAEGIARVEPERIAAQEALKQSSLSDAKVYIGGMAALYKDMSDGAKYDLMIAVVASLTLIFLIMMMITRSLVAAVVILGTASSSIAASFGISVLIWQHIFGQHIYWVTLVLAVIVLLAVGSDYNLLLVSRFEEEIHAGLKTGYIRAMAGSGGVVTSAGMVFAATMGIMFFSDLKAIGMYGTTVAIGLLLDTFVVRAFFMPSIAVLLGKWFWWPQVVRPWGPNKNIRGIAAHTPHEEPAGV